MTFLLYLGKVMLCSGILLGYYWLFLRNRRFHHYNRFYLQATLLLSVILPFFRIPVWHSSQSRVSEAVYQTLEVLTVNNGEEEALTTGPGPLQQLFTLENALYLLYGIGIVVLLWMLGRSLLYIKRISKQYPFERIGTLKFFTTREPGTPFSFFRSIFWNNDLAFNSHDGQQIFRHELFHVQQKHSTDIILTEIVTAFFWYNPFFHLLKKELKAIHEFLADQYAISDSDRYAYAELLVLQTIKANHIPITNYFFQNHIKRRISMITNNHSTRYSYRSRLMALPVLALVFCSIALYAQRSTNSVSTVFHPVSTQKNITVVIDAGHGGPDNGAMSADGKYLEKNLALEISKKIQQLASSYNINVVMTRTDDNLPGGATAINAGLRARTTITENAKADLFVAIHVSASGESTTTKSGFEIYVGNKDDNKNTQLSKQFGTVMLQELSKIYQTNTGILQRQSKGIWVLEYAPCPAVLIECGYITNDKDAAFFTNSSNQEAVAKKILEGIVNYKNKPAAAVNTPATTEQPVAPNARVEKLAKPVVAAAPTTPVKPAINVSVGATPGSQEISIDQEDPIIAKLEKHYCRNARYPKQALDHNAEGVVYFSIAIDKHGDISELKVYDQAPVEARQLNKVSTTSFIVKAAESTTTEQLSKEETMKLLQEEVKRTFEKKPDLSGHTPKSAQYFFQVKFSLEKRQAPTV